MIKFIKKHLKLIVTIFIIEVIACLTFVLLCQKTYWKADLILLNLSFAPIYILYNIIRNSEDRQVTYLNKLTNQTNK